jgi:hypothetical protein
MADLVKGDFQGAIEAHLIGFLRIYGIGAEFLGGDDGNVILGIFAAEDGFVKLIFIVGYQLCVRNPQNMPPVLFVKDPGKEIGIDTVHNRGFVTIQFKLPDGAPKGIQDPVSNHFEAAEGDIAACPNNVQH